MTGAPCRSAGPTAAAVHAGMGARQGRPGSY